MRAYHLFERWLAECRPDTQYEILDFYIPLKPIGKGRPRGEDHHTPLKTRTWTDYFGSCAAEIMVDSPTIDFPVAAKVIFGLHKNRADTDNLEKALWDAMQRGDKRGKLRVIQDDKYVRKHVEKGEFEVPKGEEFVWVRFYALNGDDYNGYNEERDRLSDRIEAGY